MNQRAKARAGIAQLEEQRFRKPQVGGSKPSAGSKPAPTFDWDEIDALRQHLAQPFDAPAPARSFTVKEYAAKYRVPYRTAVTQLCGFVATGKLKTGHFRMPDQRGHVRMLRRYWQ